MPLERFSAAWREAYVREATADERRGDPSECVFCDLLASGASEESGIFVTTTTSFGILNAYPYGSGHVLVLPRRHIGDLAELDEDESVDDEELAQLRSDPRDHGDGCNANCWCWS